MIIARIIIFSSNVERLAEFYRKSFGLKTVGEAEPGWVELAGGGSNLAIHGAEVDTRNKGDTGIKIVFGDKRVKAARSRLVKLGVKMGAVHQFGKMLMTDGRDPDGNRFQVSSRGM